MHACRILLDRARLALSPRSVLALGLLGLPGAGCHDCNDPGCVGGFRWHVRTFEGETLEAGTYATEVTLEDTRYTITCTINDTAGTCTEPTRVEGDADFSVHMVVTQADEGPASGFRLMAAEGGHDGIYRWTRGPERVHVIMLRDGEPFVEVQYELTYERDHLFYGHEDCGYCDESVTRTVDLGTSSI